MYIRQGKLTSGMEEGPASLPSPLPLSRLFRRVSVLVDKFGSTSRVVASSSNALCQVSVTCLPVLDPCLRTKRISAYGKIAGNHN